MVPDATLPDAVAEALAPAERPLFNGTDLSGWIWVSADPAVGVKDVFSVVGGTIHSAGTPNGYLRTEATFTSFVLTLELRHLRAGNGGVFLRVQPPDKIWPRAIECQGQSGQLGDVLDLDGFPLQADPARTQGIVTVRLHPEVAERPLMEWNDYEITLAGDSLTVKVNGTLQNEVHGCAVLPGAIALQSEGAEYEFRDILLRPLD